MKSAGQPQKNDPSSPGVSLQKELLCSLSEVALDKWHIWPQMSHFGSAPLGNDLLFPRSMNHQ